MSSELTTVFNKVCGFPGSSVMMMAINRYIQRGDASMMTHSKRLWFWGSVQPLVVGAVLVVGAGQVCCWADESKSNLPSTDLPKTTPNSAVAANALAVALSPTPGIEQLTFADLKLNLKKNQPYDPSLLPVKLKQLEGKTVRILGWMLPAHQQSGITQFVLTYNSDYIVDNAVLVEMTPPVTVKYAVHAMNVEGTFSLREVKGPDGKVIAIYHLEGKKVQLIPDLRMPPSKDGC